MAVVLIPYLISWTYLHIWSAALIKIIDHGAITVCIYYGQHRYKSAFFFLKNALFRTDLNFPKQSDEVNMLQSRRHPSKGTIVKCRPVSDAFIFYHGMQFARDNDMIDEHGP